MANDKLLKKLEEQVNTYNYDYKNLAILILALKNDVELTYLKNPAFNFNQRLEIYKGLASGLDVSIYSERTIPSENMKLLRLELIKNNDITPLLEFKEDPQRMKLMLDMINNNHMEFLNKYGKDKKISNQTLEILYKANNDNLDLSYFDEYPDLKPDSIYDLLFNLLRKNRDLSKLKTNKFSSSNILELLLAYDEELDVSILLNPKFSQMQLRQLRLGLAAGLDVSLYADETLSVVDMKLKRAELLDKQTRSENISEIKYKQALNTVSDLENELK